MAIPRTASGKMDKRSKEYKEFKERVSKPAAKPVVKKSSGAKRTADGTLDKPFRTIQEAVNYLSYMQGYKGGYINVKSTYKDNSGKNPLTLNHIVGYTIDITGSDVGQLDLSAHDSIGSIIVKDASQLTGSVTRSTMYFSCNTQAVNSTLAISSGTCVSHNITFSDIDRVFYEEV